MKELLIQQIRRYPRPMGFDDLRKEYDVDSILAGRNEVEMAQAFKDAAFQKDPELLQLAKETIEDGLINVGQIELWRMTALDPEYKDRIVVLLGKYGRLTEHVAAYRASPAKEGPRIFNMAKTIEFLPIDIEEAPSRRIIDSEARLLIDGLFPKKGFQTVKVVEILYGVTLTRRT